MRAMPPKSAAPVERICKEKLDTARALVSDNKGAIDRAIVLVTEAIQLDPVLVSALVLRSTLLSRIGRFLEAIDDLSLAVTVERGHATQSLDSRRLAGLYGSRAALYKKLNRYEDARVDVRAAIDLEPDSSMWLYEMGRLYMKDRSQTRLAQVYFQSAVQEKGWSRLPDVIKGKAYTQYGLSCLVTGEYGRAQELLKKALEFGETAALYNAMGLAMFYEQVSVRNAVAFFTKAIERDGQSVAFHRNLGLSQFQLGNYEEALQCLNEAILRCADDPSLRFYRSCIQLQLGMIPQGIVDLSSCAVDVPGEAADDSSDADFALRRWYGLGLLYLSSGSTALQTALECFQQGLAASKNSSVPCMIQLGMILHELGDRHGALQILQQAVQCTPPDKLLVSAPHQPLLVALYLHMALVYGDLGYADLCVRALTNLWRAAATFHDMPAALRAHFDYRTAVAFIESNDPVGALPYSRNAVKFYTSNTTTPAASSKDGGGFLPLVEAAHLQSVVLLHLRRYQEALEWSTLAIRTLSPTEAPVHLLHRATVLFDLEKYDEASRDSSACISKCSASSTAMMKAIGAKALYLRSRTSHVDGDYETALADMASATELDPSLTSCSTFCYSRGVLNALLSKPEEALVNFSAAITNWRGSAISIPSVYYHERAKTLQQLGDFKSALADYNRVIGDVHNPQAMKSWTALVNRALALKELKLFSEAARDWGLALRNDQTGLLSQLSSRDIFEIPYIPLCPAGEEVMAK